MRRCYLSTKSAIVSRGVVCVNAKENGWLRAAVWDALHDKPMSLRRERRMCVALGIEPPSRTVYWRPCLPPHLRQRCAEQDLAQVIEAGLKTLEKETTC